MVDIEQEPIDMSKIKSAVSDHANELAGLM
jgi:hypothetical protein